MLFSAQAYLKKTWGRGIILMCHQGFAFRELQFLRRAFSFKLRKTCANIREQHEIFVDAFLT